MQMMQSRPTGRKTGRQSFAKSHDATETGEPVKVLVVDDSSAARRFLSECLETDPRLHVVGAAVSASEAQALIEITDPDVITLDVEMPEVGGIDFLKHLMRQHPMPVVMCSAYVVDGSNQARRAFSAGAVDCIVKPRSASKVDRVSLCETVYQAALCPVTQQVTPSRPHPYLTLVGASTGGVTALEALFRQLPEQTPPIIVAQHMPIHFLEGFINRLDAVLPHDVGLVRHLEEVATGQIRFAPSDGHQTVVQRRDEFWVTHLEKSSATYAHNPSVDHLFLSAVPYAANVVSIILTGIGNDGALGMKTLHGAGAYTFGQTEKSCTIYGMPKAAKLMGGVEVEGDIEGLAAMLSGLLSGVAPNGVTN